MSKQIMSEYNLFMSATISDEFMIQTMNLPRDITAFIKVDPIYPAENKPVMFIGSHKLNYENMNNPNVIKELRENIYAILDQANEEKNKGIMFTSSFKLGEQLTDKFPKHTKLFLHKSGVDINKLINDFKSYQGSALLVSPSIYEGLSFDDDLSRFAILSKCPYPSLGEKRMKYIADNYPDIYKIITIKKIIQAIGRSVRNKDDHAITFVLDCNIEYLFNSQLNVWKNEFKII
jgi:Rad3-related DNA helicase